MADPGFPVGGGVDLVRGAMDPRGGYVPKILHVKTKESGPVGGGRAPGAPPPRSANGPLDKCVQTELKFSNFFVGSGTCNIIFFMITLLSTWIHCV